jgi:tetratricopeptide (TPR) repeat protein
MAEQALEQYARAEALAPNNADILMIIAWYLPSLGQPERAVTLADKALQLNPNYPYWYNQGLSIVYFFGRQYDKSVKYSKLVTDPFAADYAYLAAASAMMNDVATAQAAATNLARLDPNFSVEKLLSDGGGFPENTADFFVEAAGKAGITACVPADMVSSLPSLVHVKKCDEVRSHQAPRQTTSQSVSPL